MEIVVASCRRVVVPLGHTYPYTCAHERAHSNTNTKCTQQQFHICSKSSSTRHKCCLFLCIPHLEVNATKPLRRRRRRLLRAMFVFHAHGTHTSSARSNALRASSCSIRVISLEQTDRRRSNVAAQCPAHAARRTRNRSASQQQRRAAVSLRFVHDTHTHTRARHASLDIARTRTRTRTTRPLTRPYIVCYARVHAEACDGVTTVKTRTQAPRRGRIH